MKEAVVECVPNFSEGRDARRVEAIVSAMRVEGVRLLDWSKDADHNRSVVTIAGAPAAVLESAVRGVGVHYFTRPKRSIDLGVNAVHISSASLGDRNPGVNASIQVQVGYTFWR